MGVFPKKSCTSSPYAAPNSNPNPKNYTIVKHYAHVTNNGRQMLLLKVQYPDATNFEGMKVMVFEGYGSVAELLSATDGELDPHFANKHAAPIARFKPDSRGWSMALAFMNNVL